MLDHSDDEFEHTVSRNGNHAAMSRIILEGVTLLLRAIGSFGA